MPADWTQSRWSCAHEPSHCGSDARSPRRGHGSAPARGLVQRSARVEGNVPSCRPGTATTSHSSPFEACAVSTWTRPGVGSAFSTPRPSSCSRTDSVQARNAVRSVAVVPAPKSRAASWNAFRCRRAAAAETPGRRATSTSNPVSRITSAMRSAGSSPVRVESRRSSALTALSRARPSGEKPRPREPTQSVPSPGRESRASSRAAASASSSGLTSRAGSGASPAGSSRPPPARRARSRETNRARSCSTSRSATPMRQRGPVSRRTSWSLRVGSASTWRTASTSATSGSASSPESPSTS